MIPTEKYVTFHEQLRECLMNNIAEKRGRIIWCNKYNQQCRSRLCLEEREHLD